MKMSKHKGNVVDPWDVLDKQGADAVRWYFYTGSTPWLPSRFSGEAVSEVAAQVHGHAVEHLCVLSCSTPTSTTSIPTKHTLRREAYTLMDKWVLSAAEYAGKDRGRKP